MTLPLPSPSLPLARCRRCRRVVRTGLIGGYGPECAEREGLVVRIDRRRPTGQDDALFNLNEGEPKMTDVLTRGDWMQTYTGRAFYPLDPRPEDVDPADIAHALSMICRYGGHVRQFYSVAEHCVLLSDAVAPENALWALLHDATEAYVGDMIRPLKVSMPAYKAVEDCVMVAICYRFGLPTTCPAEVKRADLRIMRDERDALMSAAPQPWGSLDDVPALGVDVEGWAPDDAERRYLNRLRELTGGAR